jgi:hypothetical protein
VSAWSAVKRIDPPDFEQRPTTLVGRVSGSTMVALAWRSSEVLVSHTLNSTYADPAPAEALVVQVMAAATVAAATKLHPPMRMVTSYPPSMSLASCERPPCPSTDDLHELREAMRRRFAVLPELHRRR